MYDYINASKQSIELAFHWYEKAAQQGFVSAQYQIALMCATGNGVEKNTELALEWLEKAEIYLLFFLYINS